MTRRGRRGWLDAFYTTAILASRPTVFITFRLAYRMLWFVELNGRATAGAGLWHWVLPLFILCDIAQWLVLRRSDRLGLWWRLLADGLDMAFWSLAPSPPGSGYDSAVFIGIPLAAEAGVRLGAPALAVPGSALVATGVVRTLAGEKVHPFTFLWLVLAVGVGWVLNAYCRRLSEEAERKRAQVRDAECRRAFLGGQNDVAMGASSVVDAIEGVVPVLGRPEQGSALWQLAAGWKADLGDTTRSAVVYLRDTLGEWERRYNQHPDLASRVELSLSEGEGTVMLSAAQAAWLHTWLDERRPRGPVGVAVDGDARRPPGAALRLRVGVLTAEVPADRDVVLRPVDPAPVTFVFIAGQNLSVASPGGFAIPAAVMVAMVAACLGCGLWAHRRLQAQGRAARPSIVVAAVALAILLTAVGSITKGNALVANGNTAYCSTGLMLIGYLGGIYWHRLGPRLVALVIGGAVLCGATSVLLAAGPHHLRSFVAMLLGNLVTFPTCRRISIALAHASEDHSRQARQEDRAAVDEAFLRGRETVIDLVRRARDDACRQLHRIERSLEPRLAGLVADRLEEVDQRLGQMNGHGAPSLSTTTS